MWVRARGGWMRAGFCPPGSPAGDLQGLQELSCVFWVSRLWHRWVLQSQEDSACTTHGKQDGAAAAAVTPSPTCSFLPGTEAGQSLSVGGDLTDTGLGPSLDLPRTHTCFCSLGIRTLQCSGADPSSVLRSGPWWRAGDARDANPGQVQADSQAPSPLLSL